MQQAYLLAEWFRGSGLVGWWVGGECRAAMACMHAWTPHPHPPPKPAAATHALPAGCGLSAGAARWHHTIVCGAPLSLNSPPTAVSAWPHFLPAARQQGQSNPWLGMKREPHTPFSRAIHSQSQGPPPCVSLTLKALNFRNYQNLVSGLIEFSSQFNHFIYTGYIV